MGIRLNKVLSELNIGVQTVVEFLKTNHIGEVRDDLIPNSKITDEQYEALLNQYGINKTSQPQSEIMSSKNRTEQTEENNNGKKEQKDSKPLVKKENENANKESILKKIQKDNGKLFLQSKDEIDQLFNELNAQNLTVDNKLDFVIRMAIRKVKLQLYYEVKLNENRKQIKKSNNGAIIFAATISKKKKKRKKLSWEERAEKSERIKQKIENQQMVIEENLSKLFYTVETIDYVIDFLKHNKNVYDAITEKFIRNSIEGDDVLKHYINTMNEEFSNYRTIVDNMLRMEAFDNNEALQIRLKDFRKVILNYLAIKRKGKGKKNVKKTAQEPLQKDKNSSSFKALKKREWILDWNCVMFKHGHVIIYARSDLNVKFKPKELRVPKSIESFNYIKKYLNERIPPVRCIIEGQILKIIDPINFNEAILQFEAATRQGVIKTGGIKTNINYSPLPMSFGQALSKAKQMTPEEFKKYKSKYIDFLVDLQSKNYKIIPCVERLAHINSDTTEYSFMFTIECTSNVILIVHENVNPDRSTLLFLVKRENYDNTIREIYDFLQSPEINKRSSLREKSLDIKNAGVLRYRSINHDEIYSWKSWINYYKNHS